MTDYTKLVDYAAKDALAHGDPAKAIKGTEVGAEFDSIATMSATKIDKSGGTFTGTVNGTTVSLSANLTFTGTGNRITGDFSNATAANRVMFQSSTANSQTVVSTIPNGTSQNSGWQAYNGSDPNNASRANIVVNNADMRITSDLTGTGSYLPMLFFTGGSERVRIDTSGQVGIGCIPSNVGLDIVSTGSNGQIKGRYASGGSGWIINQTSSGGPVYLYQQANSTLTIGTNNTDRFVVGALGQWGIGGATYGNLGEVMQSAGASAAPTWSAPTTLSTMQATTSGTSKDFSSIPAGVKEINIMFNSFSTNGSSHYLIQIGDSGGLETTGYAGGSSAGTSSTPANSSVTGFQIYNTNSAYSVSGSITLRLMDSSTNLWTISGVVNPDNASVGSMCGGSKALSATLDRLRVTTVNGTDAMDLGNVNVSWQY